MNQCSKCQRQFKNHRFIIDEKIYCSPGCYHSDKHTGWIYRVYKELDKNNKTNRPCKKDNCCIQNKRIFIKI